MKGFRAAFLAAALLGCSGRNDEVIDAHTHFWDPARPVPRGREKAVPFSNGKTVLPDDFLRAARAAGVTGTVVVEASGWVEDNAWVLELARRNPIIVGVIGNLNEVLGTPRFPGVLASLAADPLFRGIRLGRAEDLARPEWKEHLTALAEKGLAVDLNAGGAAAVALAAENARRFPGLKIVLDHAGYVDFGRAPGEDWVRAFRKAAAEPNVYCKVSRFQEQSGAKPAPRDVEHYRAVLDLLWDAFGEDRLLFGSNWPLSESAGTLAEAVDLMNAYLRSKGPDAAAKFFRGNSRRVYGWPER